MEVELLLERKVLKFPKLFHSSPTPIYCIDFSGKKLRKCLKGNKPK